MNHPRRRALDVLVAMNGSLVAPRSLKVLLWGGLLLIGASHFWTSAVAADLPVLKAKPSHFMGEASIAYAADAISPEVGGSTGRQVTIKADILFCKSSAQPNGTLCAVFEGANMTMKASALDWLVVSPKQIEMKGPCFLDDSDGFVFQLKIDQATEAGKRRMRLKIWEAAKPSHIVFDNQRDENWNAPSKPSSELVSGDLTVG